MVERRFINCDKFLTFLYDWTCNVITSVFQEEEDDSWDLPEIPAMPSSSPMAENPDIELHVQEQAEDIASPIVRFFKLTRLTQLSYCYGLQSVVPLV